MTPEPDDSARYWSAAYDRPRRDRYAAPPPPPAPAPGDGRRPVAALVAVSLWIVVVAVEWPLLGAAALVILPVAAVHVVHVLQGGRLRDAPIEAVRHFGKRFS